MLTRRAFLQSATAGAGLALFWRGPTLYARAERSRPAAVIAEHPSLVPGGTLDPAAIPKFVTPMLIPPVMPRAGILWRRNGKPIDYYEIAVRQFQQQILPAPLPPTTVWGYGPAAAAARNIPLIFNAPSLTIEANWNRPVRVKWINELRANPADPSSPYLPHLLPVDPTLHWANPPGGVHGRDTRPAFASTPGSYTGPVPLVTHVHGAAGVRDDSDGYAEAWYLPVAGNLPAGFATEGTWYDFFKASAAANYGVAWGPGFAVFQYPNTQRAGTVWYHDHTLGMTRLNVYAGPAGFYLVRGGPDGDLAVRDKRTGWPALLPGPAPKEIDYYLPVGGAAGVTGADAGTEVDADALLAAAAAAPATGEDGGALSAAAANETNFLWRRTGYYEIPIAIQDRAFNADGSLFYPDSRAFFDGAGPDYLPATDVSPIWNPEFFGNCIMVNGATWPFLAVEQRRYRLRFLNGCDARVLLLDFSAIPGVRVWMIGNEGGFLPAPVNLTAGYANQLLLGGAERADVIVDFTAVPAGSYTLLNRGPDAPFMGLPIEPDEVADPDSTGQVLQFRVGPARSKDYSTPPEFLVLPRITPLPAATVTRRLALLEELSQFYADAPAELRLGTVAGDPNTGPATWTPLQWMGDITENPAVGTTEIWEYYNATVDAHPMHIHEAVFELISRQPIFVDEANRTFQVVPGSVAVGPQPWERGFKDTVLAYPGEVTRVKARFNTPGRFVWHCHIVEHEDNEMMRPYHVGPVYGPSSMMHGAGMEDTDGQGHLFMPDVRNE